MKKIWITGSRGRTGQALMSLLDVVEYEIFDTDKDEVDITDENQVYSFIKMNRPDVIINCSGFHEKTGSLKENVDHSYDVNAVGARNLAQAAEHINAKLIQLSTDDIFSEKTETPYNEFDFPKPESFLSITGRAGNSSASLMESCCRICHNCSRVAIEKNYLDALFSQGFAGLRTGIIKLSRLPYNNRP